MTVRGWVNGDAKPLDVDTATNALAEIRYPHKEIHQGNGFHCDDVQSAGAATIQQWTVEVTNDSKVPHLVFGVEGSGKIEVVVREDLNEAHGAVEQAIINQDRNNSNTPNTSVYHRDVSGTIGGAATLVQRRSGTDGQQGGKTSPGSARISREFILKQNTDYGISVETFTGTDVSLELTWYEHESLRT